jgi:hypothetical protein
MVRRGLRRLALIFAGGLAGTAVVSALLGLAAGSSVQRAVAIGFYVDGIVLLSGCFVFGVRGPLRGVSREGDTVSIMGARSIRRASPDERSEATRTAIILFVLGLAIVAIGSLIDPAHKTF